jgi:hypothetical protein
LIFQHVTWTNQFPDNIEKIYYRSDIGKTTNPSTVVKVGVNGSNLYLEKKAYQPTPSPNEYIPLIRNAIPKDAFVWADCAEPGYISDCRRAGLKVLGVHKFQGSIEYGISLLKKYNFISSTAQNGARNNRTINIELSTELNLISRSMTTTTSGKQRDMRSCRTCGRVP